MAHLLQRLGPPDAGPAQQCSSRVCHTPACFLLAARRASTS